MKPGESIKIAPENQTLVVYYAAIYTAARQNYDWGGWWGSGRRRIPRATTLKVLWDHLHSIIPMTKHGNWHLDLENLSVVRDAD